MKRALEDAVQMWPELFNVDAAHAFLVRWQRMIDTLSADVIILIALHSENVRSMIRVNRRFRDVIVSRKLDFMARWMKTMMPQQFWFAIKPMLAKTEPKSLLPKLLAPSSYRVYASDKSMVVSLSQDRFWYVNGEEVFASFLDQTPANNNASRVFLSKFDHACLYDGNDDCYSFGVIRVSADEIGITGRAAENKSFGSIRWTGPLRTQPSGRGFIGGEEYEAILTYKKVKTDGVQ
jgi:hypothetical protein